MKPEKQLSRVYLDTLVNSALLALPELDVPVSAIIVYNGKIIGTGYNTVIKNKKIGEHAEINAISSAINETGFNDFKNLDRDSLIMITTFEPCLMCTGAILEYNIKNVYIAKEKSFRHNLKVEWQWLKYILLRHKINDGNIQDSLFKLHPGYLLQGN